MESKNTLRKLLASGKTNEVIEQLLYSTTPDKKRHGQTLALLVRYKEYLREKHTGTNETHNLDMELNSINSSVLNLIQQLPANTNNQSAKKRWSWEKIALYLGILASIAGITGYSIKNFIPKEKESIEVTQPSPPAVETTTPPKLDKEVKKKNKQASSNNPKNNMNIEVKDSGKVGNIILGDSNKIDIKQEF